MSSEPRPLLPPPLPQQHQLRPMLLSSQAGYGKASSSTSREVSLPGVRGEPSLFDRKPTWTTWSHRTPFTVLAVSLLAIGTYGLCAALHERVAAPALNSVASRVLVVGAAVDPMHGFQTTEGGPPQPFRLRITNGCREQELWLVSTGSGNALPPRPLVPMASADFEVPALSSAAADAGGRGPQRPVLRFWPRFGCNGRGEHCIVGATAEQSMNCRGQRKCPRPLVDTKFEASFGRLGAPCNTSADQWLGCDIIDVGLQDGFTVPFRLKIRGDCRRSLTGAAASRGAGRNVKESTVDCSGLSLQHCPEAEALLARGGGGPSMDLRLRDGFDSSIVGCYSPCSKLQKVAWDTSERTLSDGHEVADLVDSYCCPDAESCWKGRAASTTYAQNVHEMCPGIDAYKHDAGISTGTCPAGTQYEMVFLCPAGSWQPPQFTPLAA